ncbi:MAG: bifunctional phosphoglucose/phosphomannose isomerase, partial [Chloroflexi bacterium]|nr:bifunctional phosphoglucose/phosphomannose isomerase [Chloroflexota bacterium]
VTVIRDFRLPFNLDPKSLFIACSYSGETEETLALFHQAQRQGTPLLAVAGGGGLANEAASAGVPLLIINAPGEPRSAVGYNLMLLLGALAVGGIVKIDQSQVETAIAGLETQIGRLAEDVREKDNVAKQMARELMGRLVVVYGGGLFTGMARRWKTQLNENAKAWAFYESIPELLHNSVVAFDAPGPVAQDKMALVLKPSTDSAQLEGRYKVVLELLRLKNIPHRIVEATPGPPLAQQLSMLALGDYVSYYLALLQGIDPSPVPAIDLGKDLSNDV